MIREVTDLLASSTLEVIPRHTIPSDNPPLQPIWSFRRKRAPYWSILKYKARLCPNGWKQIEGINFWETYAPVVSWRTVHLTLILSLLSGLKSRQVDYVSAYTQAPLDCELFMNIPPGFIIQDGVPTFTTSSTRGNSTDYLLKFKKNMYGLKQAGKSAIDPCLFIRPNCMIIVYVDDCLLFAKTDSILDSVVASLQSEFHLTSQGNVGAFLGVDIHRNANGFLELTQPGLITKIISSCGLESDSNQHRTSSIDILLDDPNGPECEHTWNYQAIIGMLTYLSTSTRPDIAFSVHQCARFSSHPKRLHELAVCWIVCYLKGTQDKGYILRPLLDHCRLECYVVTDFAGLWSSTNSHDPISVRSRTGYVITFANCLVLWSSKL